MAVAMTTSCKFLVSTDAAVSASSAPAPQMSFTSPSNANFVTKGRPDVIPQQMKRGLAITASTESDLSRRKTLMAGVSTLGLLLLPDSRAAEARNKDPDMREQIMEDIENLQKRVSKTLEEAKKAVTSMAEDAIASLKFSGEKAAEKIRHKSYARWSNSSRQGSSKLSLRSCQE